MSEKTQINMQVFDSFPVLKTPRLTLRSLTENDVPAIFGMRSSALVSTHIMRPLMQQDDAAKQLVEKTIAAYKNKLGIAWAAVLRDAGDIIGTCGFNRIEYAHARAEIGGEMNPAYWGKRLPPEAVQAIIDFGFGTMNLHSIEARVLPGNRSAIALLEMLGFEKEAHFRDYYFYGDAFHDLAVYGLRKP
jgi:ribosomal-protein-alanine N-acetyltransferase